MKPTISIALITFGLTLCPPAQAASISQEDFKRFDRSAVVNTGIFLGRMEILCKAGGRLIDQRVARDLLAISIRSAERVIAEAETQFRPDIAALEALKRDNPDCIKLLPAKYQ